MNLTKRILNSGEASLETDIQQVPDSDIAMEVMEEILLTNEGSEEVNDKLQNLENIVSEKSDSKGNDIRINGNIFEDQEDFVKISKEMLKEENQKKIF